jgi:iron complex outermembrane receptor protein
MKLTQPSWKFWSTLSALGFAFIVTNGSARAAEAASSTSSTTTTSVAPQQLEKLVVVGSYLPVSAEVNASPVIDLDRSAIERSGATDPLRLLKSLTPVFSGSGNVGNEVNFQGVGESSAALRNLTTLVLVNGRRLGNSPFSSNTAAATIPAVDLNTIPMGMIERIEILKDGASTIYGSDAIGGVINVILRKNYNGFEVGGRYGTDRNGDYQTKEGWAIGGVGRPGASLTIGGQYFESTKLISTARKIGSLAPTDLVALGQNPAVLAAHVSSTFAGRNGNFIIAGSPLAAGAPGYNANIKSLPPKTDPNAAPRTTADLQAAGYYVPITDTTLSKQLGGSATILNTAIYGFALVLPNERRQAFGSGSMEIFGKKLEIFGDFLLSKTNNGGSDLAPAPIAAVAPSGLTIPGNNPYNLFGVTIGVGGVPGAPGVRTRLEEIGSRSSDNKVDMHRLVFGLRGEINEQWNWEAAFSEVQADGSQVYYGGANGAVMNQLLIPQLTAGGTAYVYDSNGRPLSVYSKNGRNLPVYDYFGVAGSNAPETIDALRTTLFRSASVEQSSLDLRLVGKLFELPSGEISVAVGGETRRERISSSADATFNAGLALGYIPVNNLDRGDRSTKAAFLETNVPLASPKNGIPLAHRADLTAAVRHERIRPGGDATTPKFGLRWLPFGEQFVVRATYAEGFIAPSVFALFGPSQGAIPTLALPEGNGSTGSGGSTGRTVTGQFIGQTAELSNRALTPAKSKSYTYGVVYSPRQIKGLNFSAGYYHIEQDKVGGFDYTVIVADLNARGAASIYAPNFRFTDGTTMTTNAPNQVTSTNAGVLKVVYNPLGDLWTDGLDFAVNYTTSTEIGVFSAGVDVNVLLNFQARTNPSVPYLQYAGVFTETLNGKGNPQGVLADYVGRARLDHTYRGVTTSLRVSHLPSVDAPGTSFGEKPGTPNILRANLGSYTIPSYTTADVSLSYTLPDFGRRWLKKLKLTAGVNNVFDKEPPFVPGGGSGVGSESNTVKSTYDIIGRFMFIEARKEF